MGILYGTPEKKVEYSHKRKSQHPNREEKAVAAHCDTLSFVRELKNKKHTHTFHSFILSARWHALCVCVCVGLGMFVALVTRFAEYTIWLHGE